MVALRAHLESTSMDNCQIGGLWHNRCKRSCLCHNVENGIAPLLVSRYVINFSCHIVASVNVWLTGLSIAAAAAATTTSDGTHGSVSVGSTAWVCTGASADDRRAAPSQWIWRHTDASNCGAGTYDSNACDEFRHGSSVRRL
jgi:hypothetical protein